MINNRFKVFTPKIFDDKKVVAGVTNTNYNIFPGTGFSVFPGKILNDVEVERHRKYLAEKLDSDIYKMKFQKQIHGSKIRIINRESKIEESDGMITDELGLILNITIADCCAVLVHDPVANVIGAFHSGWKGTREKIVVKGLQMMAEKYNLKTGNQKIWLTPCASGKNYEVGEEFTQIFPDSVSVSEGKFYFDMKKEILSQLKSNSVIEKMIEISNICTIENKDYHSFRRDGNKSGRMSAFIGLI